MFNLRTLLIAVGLTVILAITNAYLALKVGLLTSASIPAAMLSMALLKRSTKHAWHDQNYIQTAASSGEAIAGGVGYTLPALVLLGFWHNIHYWPAFFIAFIGGVLGMVFTMLLRDRLLNDTRLRFPEAVAISSVIHHAKADKQSFRYLTYGAIVSGLLDILQNLQLASTYVGRFIGKAGGFVMIGVGLSPALIGAGYIMGIDTGVGLLIGSILANLILLPLLSWLGHYPGLPLTIYNEHLAMPIRMIGMAVMLSSAMLMIITLLYSFIQRYRYARKHAIREPMQAKTKISKNIYIYSALGLLTILLTLSLFIPALNPFHALLYLGYLLLFGFFIAKISAYFSGLVGVSASPGSSLMIVSLIVSLILGQWLFKGHEALGELIAIILASIVTQIACLANDGIQDLKVGHMLGTAPQKQMLMLLLGVLIASLIVPWVMQLLIHTLGLASGEGVGTLSAPPAAMMAALTRIIDQHQMHYAYLYVGMIIVIMIWWLQRIYPKILQNIPLISIGMGIYLPLSSTTALILGALIAYLTKYYTSTLNERAKGQAHHRKLLFACGLITGASLMDIIIAVPSSIYQTASFNLHWPLWSIGCISVLAIITLIGFFLNPSFKLPITKGN